MKKMEERERDGQGQQEPLMPEMPQPETPQVVSPETTERKTQPSPYRRLLALGWILFLITLVVAFVLGAQLVKERRQNYELSQQISRMQTAVLSARKVFLERAAAELGYASVDLQADPPKRYQVAFRLDEASRWLRDAEPLLSDSGRIQAQNIQQMLRQLPTLVEQDPVSARQELAKVQDALERLISTETKSP
ncbi:MAG: hypothetical protein RMK89_08445 [Armatimonadota bacterium]|nr:hypothetical protein [Armatimonadota bacterium]MDW8143475.1 hypothetical protein [Armatimonadota bacterium]